MTYFRDKTGPKLPEINLAGLEIFKEDQERNIEIVSNNLGLLSADEKDFADRLLEFYAEKGYLTNAQLSYMVRYWNKINSQR